MDMWACVAVVRPAPARSLALGGCRATCDGAADAVLSVQVRRLERLLMTNADSVDKLQWTLYVFATLCVAALFALDVYMGIG
jgi:hypothetical protein